MFVTKESNRRSFMKMLAASPLLAQITAQGLYARSAMALGLDPKSNVYSRLGVKTVDLAKRLLDHGVHPPTVYFPLIVEEALLVEPTETETKETLDRFAEVIEEILREAEDDPEVARQAPYTTPVRRLDEAAAARHPVVRQPL